MTIPTTEIETLPPAAAVLAAMFLAVQAEGGPAQRVSVQELFEDALALGLADDRIRGLLQFAPFEVAAAAYTAQLADRYRYLRFTNAGAVTFTIPPEADVAFPAGALIEFEQAGDGIVTLTAGAGVTLNSRDGALATAGKFSTAQAKYVGANTWTIIGDVA